MEKPIRLPLKHGMLPKVFGGAAGGRKPELRDVEALIRIKKSGKKFKSLMSMNLLIKV
ncbi:hypothetical protein [Pseudoalteromonas rubra]|uniref:hypothetical protein n=1 Tax=Pseudoalteromonas rubra TaxID=43658 RepID=UPI002DB81B8E|nr:hypothetical protein [Pseudoalteromonas rubra]MEC4090226.1 hypothetical protein [Pseudoalteromonas rubra]